MAGGDGCGLGLEGVLTGTWARPCTCAWRGTHAPPRGSPSLRKGKVEKEVAPVTWKSKAKAAEDLVSQTSLLNMTGYMALPSQPAICCSLAEGLTTMDWPHKPQGVPCAGPWLPQALGPDSVPTLSHPACPLFMSPSPWQTTSANASRNQKLWLFSN